MPQEVTDHPFVVPTVVGPVGGVVSEPPGELSGALVLLQGLGPPGRAGVNANWTRLARELARELSLAVLRFDFCSEGESTPVGGDVVRGSGWRRSTDLAALREIAPWFMQTAGKSELLIVGSCHGGRVALEYAAGEPAVRGLFLITPFMQHEESVARQLPEGQAGPVWANGPTLDTDAELAEGFGAYLARAPAWVLVGEPEVEQLQPCARLLEDAGAPSFELEIVPGIPIHPVGHPRQQEIVHRMVRDRVGRAVPSG